MVRTPAAGGGDDTAVYGHGGQSRLGSVRSGVEEWRRGQTRGTVEAPGIRSSSRLLTYLLSSLLGKLLTYLLGAWNPFQLEVSTAGQQRYK